MKPYYRVYDEKEYSTYGTQFDSHVDAEQLALELATKYPGSTFEILRCVGYSSTSKASTFWMDGEGPEKPRYRMLEDGEIIQSGDQFTPDGGETWTTARDAGADYRDSSVGHFCKWPHLPHRRPL